jgi:glycosyltransferase involved in cell wall biosynthesis
MRVGIDGGCWLNRRGYGRFARELVTALAALGGDVEYTLMVDFDPAGAPPLPPGVRVVRVPTVRPAARAASAAGRRSLRDLWAMSRAIRRERFDVMFFPSAYTYVPVGGRERVVVGIHDLIPEELPRHVFPTKRGALHWWLKLLAARRRADLIVTVSEASRQGIVRRFAMAGRPIAVISEAAAQPFRPLRDDPVLARVLARWELAEGRFLLHVGGPSPHKNLEALVDAVAEVRRRAGKEACKLALVGDYEGDVFFSAHEAVRRRIVALAMEEAVVFTGYVDDATLAFLYNGAAALVLPSLAEGFGLPAVEAMACGTPVVASRRGALPEVLGGAGLLFDPEHPGDLGALLERLLADPDLRGRLRSLGLRRATDFSWERAARHTFGIFLEVTGASCPAAGQFAPRLARQDDGAGGG